MHVSILAVIVVGMYVIYTRVSRDPDATSTSPAAQHAECLALARSHGWPDPAHVSDVDLSAWSRTVTRPGWTSIVDGIHAGSVDGLIVHHVDRMLRQSRELEALIDAIESRGTRSPFPVYSVNGDLDLSTPDGRAMARILIAVAQKESDDKSRRIKLKKADDIRAGRVLGGGRPFGYEVDQTPIPSEVAALHMVADWVLEGLSLSECCRRLEAAGIRTPRGSRWYPGTLSRLLRNQRYVGRIVHDGRVLGDAPWEPVLSVDVFNQVQAALAVNEKFSDSSVLRYWLNGVLTCGRCGASLMSAWVSNRTTRRRVYRCKGAGCFLAVAAPNVEQILADVGLSVMAEFGVGVHEAPPADQLAALQARVDDLSARLSQLSADYYTEALITRDEFLAARTPLSQQLSTVQDELAAHRAELSTTTHPDQLLAAWDNLPPVTKQQIMTRIYDEVIIAPSTRRGARFDPSRISIRFNTR